MNIRKLLFAIMIGFVAVDYLHAQAPSDTISVQTFNYNSITRDSVFEFPQLNTGQVERVWMRYAMRCKDGLISTGSNTNLGCGEWDYTCSTYLTDSSRIDSLAATVNRYLVYPQSSLNNSYSQTPTYNVYHETHQNVFLNSTISESDFGLSTGSSSSNSLLS